MCNATGGSLKISHQTTEGGEKKKKDQKRCAGQCTINVGRGGAREKKKARGGTEEEQHVLRKKIKKGKKGLLSKTMRSHGGRQTVERRSIGPENCPPRPPEVSNAIRHETGNGTRKERS